MKRTCTTCTHSKSIHGPYECIAMKSWRDTSNSYFKTQLHPRFKVRVFPDNKSMCIQYKFSISKLMRVVCEYIGFFIYAVLGTIAYLGFFVMLGLVLVL